MEIPFDHFSCSFAKEVQAETLPHFDGAAAAVPAKPCWPLSTSTRSAEATSTSVISNEKLGAAPLVVRPTSAESNSPCNSITVPAYMAPPPSSSFASSTSNGCRFAAVATHDDSEAAVDAGEACRNLLDIPLHSCAATFVFDALLMQQLAAWRLSNSRNRQPSFGGGGHHLYTGRTAAASQGACAANVWPCALVYVQPTSAHSPPDGVARQPTDSLDSFSASQTDCCKTSTQGVSSQSNATGQAHTAANVAVSRPAVRARAPVATQATSIPETPAGTDTNHDVQAPHTGSPAAASYNKVRNRAPVILNGSGRSSGIVQGSPPTRRSSSRGTRGTDIRRSSAAYGRNATAEKTQIPRAAHSPGVKSEAFCAETDDRRSFFPEGAPAFPESAAAISTEQVAQVEARNVRSELATRPAAAETASPAASLEKATAAAAFPSSAEITGLSQNDKVATAVAAAQTPCAAASGAAIAPHPPTAAGEPTAAAPSAADKSAETSQWRRHLRGGCWMRTTSKTVPLLLHLSSTIDLLGNRSAAAQRIYKEPMTSLAKLEADSLERYAERSRRCCRCCCCSSSSSFSTFQRTAAATISCAEPRRNAGAARDSDMGRQTPPHTDPSRSSTSTCERDGCSIRKHGNITTDVYGDRTHCRHNAGGRQHGFSFSLPLLRPPGEACGRCRCCSGSWRLYMHVEAGLLRGFCKLGRRTLWLSRGSSTESTERSSRSKGRNRFTKVPNDFDVISDSMEEVCCAPVLLGEPTYGCSGKQSSQAPTRVMLACTRIATQAAQSSSKSCTAHRSRSSSTKQCQSSEQAQQPPQARHRVATIFVAHMSRSRSSIEQH